MSQGTPYVSKTQFFLLSITQHIPWSYVNERAILSPDDIATTHPMTTGALALS